MILLLVIGMILVLIMGTTGALSPWFSILLLAAGSWVLLLQFRQKHAVMAILKTRKQALQADEAMVLRHLGGLKVPVEALIYAYFQPGRLVLESDTYSRELTHEQNPFLILLTPENRLQILEQIQSPSDDPAGLRVLSELKERIRRQDRSVRTNRILILLYRNDRQEPCAAAFLVSQRKKAIQRILATTQFDPALPVEPGKADR